ncbi:MAG: p-hydroxycinnamoyl CoA hydratase/lyase, partial [Caulobacteraceae bacterium]
TRELCDVLMQKNPNVLKAAKDTFKRTADMPWDLSEDYIIAKMEQLFHLDKMKGRNTGIKQFLDDKTLRPGLGTYDKTREIS